KRQDTTVDVEAGNAVHYVLRRYVDRQVSRRERERLLHSGQTRLQDQNRARLEPTRREEDVEDHLALGNEQPLAPDEVSFADGVIGDDARIVRIFDANGFGWHGLPATSSR